MRKIIYIGIVFLLFFNLAYAGEVNKTIKINFDGKILDANISGYETNGTYDVILNYFSPSHSGTFFNFNVVYPNQSYNMKATWDGGSRCSISNVTEIQTKDNLSETTVHVSPYNMIYFNCDSDGDNFTINTSNLNLVVYNFTNNQIVNETSCSEYIPNYPSCSCGSSSGIIRYSSSCGDVTYIQNQTCNQNSCPACPSQPACPTCETCSTETKMSWGWTIFIALLMLVGGFLAGKYIEI